MRLKKLLAVLMTIAMIVCLLPATAFAANNTATTMRLAKTQGTVKVTNSTGKEVSQTENMKLYNGYKVKTGAKSYAWISLDDTKVAKVDANSCIEVQKSGKALTLFLSSGNLFFNAKQPLKGGETFNIKTSTMTTGIRGTSGCVTVVSARVTEIDLLTGKLEIVTEHPTLGMKKTAVLLAGQSATSMIDWEAMAVSGEMAEIIIDQLTADEVCGSCAIEIAADPALLERIEKEAPQLLPSLIVALAETKLAEDEAADAEKQKNIDEAAANQTFPEDVDPLFEEEAAGGGGGGGSNPAAPVPTVVEVNGWETTEAGLGLKDQIAAANNGEVDEIDLTGDVTVPANESFVVDAGNNVTLNLGTSSLTLTNTSIENNGDMTITNTEGYIIGSGGMPAVVNNEGATLTMDDGAIDANGYIGVMNHGAFTMTGGEIIGSENWQCVENYGTFTMKGGTIIGEGYYGILNEGEVIMEGGTITGCSVGIYNNLTDEAAANTIIMTGGTIEVPDSYAEGVSNYGTFTMNGGTIIGAGHGIGINNMDGIVTLNSGAVLKNLGTAVRNEGGESDKGLLKIAGAYFENLNMMIDNSSGGTVTQTAATLKGVSDKYINNYFGTANIEGGPIGCEGCSTGIYNQGGTVTVGSGTHDVYAGIHNLNGGVVNVNSGAVMQVWSGVGVYSYGDFYDDGTTVTIDGSIIAESGATALEQYDTNTIFGENFVLKAKAMDKVLGTTSTPEGYVLNYVDGYYQLVKGDTENTVVAETEAQFVQALASAADGGGFRLSGNKSEYIIDAAVLEELELTSFTTNSTKDLIIEIPYGNTLTLAVPFANSGTIHFTGGGSIIIEDNGVIENAGTLNLNEITISGTADTLIRNSGTLNLNKNGYIKVFGGCGVDNIDRMVINQQNSYGDVYISVTGGVGIYSHGESAELILQEAYILASDTATAMIFDGGTVYLNGGEITAGHIDGTYNYAIVDKTAGASAVSGDVKTIITAYADSWEYVDGEYILASKPRDVVKCVYDGILPEGYYVKYIPTDDEFKLQAHQDLKNLLVDVYRYTGVPNQTYIDNDYVYDDLVLDFTEELKLAEDMTIDLAAVKKYLTGPEYDYVFSTLPMVSVESTTGTLLIDLMGHTLTLDVPIEVYGNLKIIDSVGGGKIVTSLEEPFILDGTYVQEEHPDVTNNLTVDESLIEKVQEEPVEELVEELAEEPAEEPVDEPMDEPVDEPAEELVEEPAEEPADEPTEEPVDEPAEELTEEPVDEPAEEPVDEPTDESANEPTEEPEEESVDEQQENETEEQELVSVEDGGESVPVE